MRLVFLCALLVFAIACDDPGDDQDSKKGKPTTAKLISSKLSSSSGLRLSQSTTLTNVTGLADSLGLNFTEDLPCGFHLWGANGQTSRSGTEGRSYEQFDLGDPVSWSSTGDGLQGECESATVAQVEAYFVYMNLHLSVDGVSRVVRVYLGDQDPFKAGDLASVNGTEIAWLDTGSNTLVDSTLTRPASPKKIELAKEIPWFDNNGADKIIMQEFRIQVTGTYTVTKDTGHVTVDVDFSKAGITGNGADIVTLMNGLTLPFVTASFGDNILTATLEVAESEPATTP